MKLAFISFLACFGAQLCQPTLAEVCNANQSECGFLANRTCPDPFSRHPGHLTQCCGVDALGCARACCAPGIYGNGGGLPSYAIIAIMVGALGGVMLLGRMVQSCYKAQHYEEGHGPEMEGMGMEDYFYNEEEEGPGGFDPTRGPARTGPLPADLGPDAPPAYSGQEEQPPDYAQSRRDSLCSSIPPAASVAVVLPCSSVPSSSSSLTAPVLGLSSEVSSMTMNMSMSSQDATGPALDLNTDTTEEEGIAPPSYQDSLATASRSGGEAGVSAGTETSETTGGESTVTIHLPEESQA